MSPRNLQENTDNKALRELRDALNNHVKEMKKSGDNTKRANEKMIDLTRAIYILTVIVVLVSCLQFYLQHK